MKITSENYRVRAAACVDLRRRPTRVKPAYKSKKDYLDLLDEHVEQLSELQRLHYASNKHALLFIFQAMDAAGKDGAISHVMRPARMTRRGTSFPQTTSTTPA